MKKVLAIVLFVSCLATSMVAQDLDSLYARDLLTVGTVVPSLTDEKGQAVALEKYRGQYVVMDYWTSWCPDCRKDMPKMRESKMVQAYHIKWIPSIYLLDPSGKVMLATVEIEKLEHLLAEIKNKQQNKSDIKRG